MKDLVWSGQQERALRDVGLWLAARDRQVYYLAGYAGTGKTTLAQYMAADVSGLVLFAAFTGKAASVLRRKGCPEARTLHSILYDVSDADRTKLRELEEELRRLLEKKATGADDALDLNDRIGTVEELIREERQRTRGPRFRLNDQSIMREADLLVLDECSMIDERLGRDALSFGKPILVLGDPAQLPPVKGAGFFTAKEPDTLLTEIHRQARDNTIISAATSIREQRSIPFGEWGDVSHVPHNQVDLTALCVAKAREGAQILVGKNESRRKINRAVRRALGFRSLYPMEGEALVILRNDSEMGVLNGVTCRAASDAVDDGDGDLAIRLDYEGGLIPESPLDRVPFDIYRSPELEEDWHPGQNRSALVADWGYALTVHKAQGSEWDEVLLVDDDFAKWNPSLRWQWLYTAITRASSRLTIVSRGAPSA